MIPADFILPLQSHNPIGEHHAQLASNCFGQTQALMQGRTFDEALAELADSPLSEAEKQLIAKHKVMEGNKPSNTLLMDKLTPITLGALMLFTNTEPGSGRYLGYQLIRSMGS